MKLIGFLLVAAALAGTVVYMAPASELDGPHLNDLPGIRGDMAIKSLWGPPDDGAVDSGGVEADLDGNASALIASDWGTTPATRRDLNRTPWPPAAAPLL